MLLIRLIRPGRSETGRRKVLCASARERGARRFRRVRRVRRTGTAPHILRAASVVFDLVAARPERRMRYASARCLQAICRIVQQTAKFVRHDQLP